MKVQPGQSHSRQAGSESCAWPGDRRAKRRQQGSRPRGFSSEIVCRRDADAVSLAEGSIQMTDNARLFGVAGVPSPGHAFKWIPREPRRTSYLSRTGCGSAQPKWNQVPRDVRVAHGKRTNPRRAATCRQGKPEAAATGRRAVLRAHSTCEGGEPQGSRKGRPRYPLEGRGKQVDASAQGCIAETQNLEVYVKWN